MPTRMFACLGLLLLPIAARASGPFAAKKVEPINIPLEQITADQRDAVKHVLEKATLSAKSAPEAFPGDVESYQFFLEHPDRAVTAWRRLGAKCVSIEARGNQTFRWADENGSEVVWQTVLSKPGLRVWFAEGKVKPTPVLPMVPVKVLVVLRSTEVTLANGGTGIQHQTEMAIHTDSKTALVVTKMLGPSSQRLAEQGLGQFQFFFGGLSFYLGRHPDQAAALKRD